MKITYAGTIELKDFGHEFPNALFLGNPIPLVSHVYRMTVEHGPIVGVNIDVKGEAPIAKIGVGKILVLISHDTGNQELKREIVFKVGDLDVYAYLLKHVGKRCRLTVEFT